MATKWDTPRTVEIQFLRTSENYTPRNLTLAVDDVDKVLVKDSYLKVTASDWSITIVPFVNLQYVRITIQESDE